MNENLEQLMTISNYLNLSDYSMRLLKMQQALEKKEYLLTVMGQFSAGKSRLINNILGKEILPVHITETTAMITLIRYGEEEYVNLLYKDGTVEDISVEESLKLWQGGENNDRFSELEQITIYMNAELLKNGLVIADTPGVNTIINKHLELTANIIESADRVLYVMGKSVTETDFNFVDRILKSGVKIVFVRTHMDDLKISEENVFNTILKEKDALLKYTEDDIFFVSNEESSEHYIEINELKKYLSQNFADKVEQALKESVTENMRFIAQKMKVELIDKRQSLDCALSNDKEIYLKRKMEVETSLKTMEDILSKNKEKLTEKYQKAKQAALEGLDELELSTTKNVQQKIAVLDYDVACEKYASSVEEILKSGCCTLQDNYLSYYDTFLRDNKEVINSQLSDISLYAQIDSDIPETLSETSRQTQEITEKLAALNALQDQIKEELSEIEDAQKFTRNEQEVALNEQQTLKVALANVQEELRKYPEYVVQYYEAQEATHDGENMMRTVGFLLDSLTILIPGSGWANIGAKLLNAGSKGAKAIKAVKTAEKLAKVAKTIQESEKALKVIDVGMDFARICNNKRMNKKECQRMEQQDREMREKAEKAKQVNCAIDTVKNSVVTLREQREEEQSILDYLSIEHYFAQIGKKFDQPQVIQIDQEYEKKYYEGKHEIERRLREQAEAEFIKRQELLDITDKHEQLKLRQGIVENKRMAAEAEEKELKKQLQVSANNDKVKAIKEYYSKLASDKISEFCEYLRGDKLIEIDKNISGYITHFDFSICTNINRKRMELEELDRFYENSEREHLKNEVAVCTEYQDFLENMIAQIVL